jgi:lipopolysaccharide export LptBFGC system permease protein LptF
MIRPGIRLSELGQLLEPGTHEQTPIARPSDRHYLAVQYHTRWALSCAPLVVSLFALAVTRRGRQGILMLGFAGCAAILGYYILMVAARGLGQDRSIPAYAAAWFPNAAFLALAAIVLRETRPRNNSSTAEDTEDTEEKSCCLRD